MTSKQPLRDGWGVAHNPSPLWKWSQEPWSTSREEWELQRLKQDKPLPEGLKQLPLFEEGTTE